MSAASERVAPEDVADLLRLADFALEYSTVAIVAFTSNIKAVTRDCERNTEVRRQIKAMLEHLPPKRPLTPEREAECREIIGRALRRIADDECNSNPPENGSTLQRYDGPDGVGTLDE